MSAVHVLEGDAMVRLSEMEAGSIDACVTDPPYGLEFMGKAWDAPWKAGVGLGGMSESGFGAVNMTDGAKRLPRPNYLGGTNPTCRNCGGLQRGKPGKKSQQPCQCDAPRFDNVSLPRMRAFQEWVETWATEALRVLKPGGYLVAFGGTRTHHRLTSGLEDAGFEIRDCLMWLHGQGFPKGKGQLKPAWEPIVLARKPAPAPWLNIDGCRIGLDVVSTHSRGANTAFPKRVGEKTVEESGRATRQDLIDPTPRIGRWPANVVLSHEDGCREVGTKRVKAGNSTRGVVHGTGAGTIYQDGLHVKESGRHYADPDGYETTSAFECEPECAVRLLDEQSGTLTSGANPTRRSAAVFKNSYGTFVGQEECTPIRGAERGGASRFYFCAKASPAERRPYNDHPTVKPLALMQWLIRLVTPPGGVVLDPFCGSGSTLVAADREGFDAIGIDQDAHAVDIARRRVAEDAQMFAEVS